MIKPFTWSLTIFVGSILLGISAFAQNLTISGSVKSDDGEALPGVTISILGTSTGTISDIDGNYTISVEEGNTELTYSYIGFQTQTVSIVGRSVVDVSMAVDRLQLDEVVVTALGVERSTKSLGYSVTEFQGENMVKARESNPVSTLTGKVAGLNVQTPTDFFQNPVITMRGGTPLVVIDGIPNPNADFWEISPDDIDNISVLKGATAAALYGSIGRNGALMITTKRGKSKLQIEVNSSTQFQTGFLRVPDPQQVYGTGDGGQYAYQGGSGPQGVWVWGPKLDQLDPSTNSGYWETPQIDSPIDPTTGNRIPTPFITQGRDNMKNFFRTGIIQSNNVNVMGMMMALLGYPYQIVIKKDKYRIRV